MSGLPLGVIGASRYAGVRGELSAAARLRGELGAELCLRSIRVLSPVADLGLEGGTGLETRCVLLSGHAGSVGALRWSTFSRQAR